MTYKFVHTDITVLAHHEPFRLRAVAEDPRQRLRDADVMRVFGETSQLCWSDTFAAASATTSATPAVSRVLSWLVLTVLLLLPSLLSF